MSTDSRPRSFPGVFVAASLAWGLGAATAAAAPITFGFNAVVTDVRLDSLSPVTFPFQVKTGDVIRGRFTFTSPPQGNYGVQTTGIEFDLGGSTIIAPTYDMRAFKNQAMKLGSGELAFIDEFDISVSIPQTPHLGNLGMPGIHWRPHINLTGPAPVLPDFQLPSEPGIWNRFTSRPLELRFFTTSVHLNIVAAIQDFQVVPETTTCFGSLLFLLLLDRQRRATQVK